MRNYKAKGIRVDSSTQPCIKNHFYAKKSRVGARPNYRQCEHYDNGVG